MELEITSGLIFDDSGLLLFSGGREDWVGAVRVAAACPCFAEDTEDEQIADDPRSCYNCRFRRWTSASFICTRRVQMNHDNRDYHD